jgi:CRISPR system Cascade subunit CasE
MYLSRLTLDVRNKVTKRWLSDVDQLHKDVLSAFGAAPSSGEARSSLGILFRLDRLRDGRLLLLVQSREAPDWGALPPGVLAGADGFTEEIENPAVKEIQLQWESLREGQILRFRLRANPTKKIDTKTGPDGRRRNGRRVELTAEPAKLAWLKRKGTQHGFEVGQIATQSDDVMDVVDVPEAQAVGYRRGAKENQGRITFGACVFEGTLRVKDVGAFRQALAGGIGSGKAFGFGLLSIAPAG